MKKKLLSLLLALCLVMVLVPMTAFAEDAQNINVWDGSTAAAFAGGTGTAEDPYQIANGAELAYLASSVNSGETYEDILFRILIFVRQFVCETTDQRQKTFDQYFHIHFFQFCFFN